jgi:hypothetical protein
VFLLFTVVVTKHVWPYFQSRFPKTSSKSVSSRAMLRHRHIFFFVPAQKKSRETLTFHRDAKVYRTVEYIYQVQHLSTNTQQPTRATATLLPSAFPSSLSMGTGVTPSNHGAAAPPRHAQATSRRDLVGVVGLIAGEGEKRGIEK